MPTEEEMWAQRMGRGGGAPQGGALPGSGTWFTGNAPPPGPNIDPNATPAQQKDALDKYAAEEAKRQAEAAAFQGEVDALLQSYGGSGASPEVRRHAEASVRQKQQQRREQAGEAARRSAAADMQARRDSAPFAEYEQLLDPNSAASRAYGWQGPTMASREALAREAQNRAGVQADLSAANVDYLNSAGARQAQLNALDLYGQAALGRGPSAAQAQFQSGLDQSIRAQQSLANSARGGGLARAAAQRAAMSNAGDMTLQAGAQSAALRAQEQQAGMAGFAGLGSQIRGQDLGAMGQRAQQAFGQADLLDRQRGRNDAQEQFYQGQAMGVGGAMTAGAIQREQDRRAQINAALAGQRAQTAEQRAAEQARTGQAIQGASAGGAAALGLLSIFASDERAKTEVRDGDGDVRAWLENLDAKTYRYKNGARDGEGDHTSVMAQALEKSPIGKRMVVETERGKMVDYAKGLPAMLAAIASVNRRVGALEKTR